MQYRCAVYKKKLKYNLRSGENVPDFEKRNAVESHVLFELAAKSFCLCTLFYKIC